MLKVNHTRSNDGTPDPSSITSYSPFFIAANGPLFEWFCDEASEEFDDDDDDDEDDIDKGGCRALSHQSLVVDEVVVVLDTIITVLLLLLLLREAIMKIDDAVELIIIDSYDYIVIYIYI
jgi:hypothetical protein